MSATRPLKRRRTDEVGSDMEKRQVPGLVVDPSAPSTGNVSGGSQAGTIPDDFSFPVILFTASPTANIQRNTFIPVATIVATATILLPNTISSIAVAPAVAPAPTQAIPYAAAGQSQMSTLVKQGTTTMEAQEGTPTLGLLAPQPDQTDKMDQWTAKILIIAGSIAGALLLLFIILIIHRWRQGKKPFSSLFSWSRKDEEEEDDARPYSSTHVLPFGQMNQHFSTYQKPIWEVNSSINSLPYKPEMTYTRDKSESRGPSPYNLGAVPSQSRFPPPNRLRTPSPVVEPAFFYRNQSSESKVGVKAHVREASQASQSGSSFGLPIDGPRIADIQSQQRPTEKPSLSSEKKSNKMSPFQKDSRFSWTNSQAPRSPPEEGGNSQGTSGSSVARYLTVDSWVGQQTNRLVEYQIQQLFDDIIEDRDRVSPGVSPKTIAPITAAVLPLYASTEILERSIMGTETMEKRRPSDCLDGELITVGRF